MRQRSDGLDWSVDQLEGDSVTKVTHCLPSCFQWQAGFEYSLQIGANKVKPDPSR